VDEVKQDELRAGPGVRAGGNLNVGRDVVPVVGGLERVLPDAHHDAPRGVAAHDAAALEEISFLVAAMPVRAVVLHDQLAAAGRSKTMSRRTAWPPSIRLLDLVTIARSRKHIEKYYGTKDVGKFPDRLPPVNLTPPIDTAGEMIPSHLEMTSPLP
jgi:hypothetical protein